jgi:membrane-associated protein
MHSRRAWLCLAGVLALAGVAYVIHASGAEDGFSLVDGSLGDLTYLAVFLLVWGDAVCALLPGETTLNAASTLAADGSLELALVIVAGALGAVVGDSTLYWIARTASGRIAPHIEKAKENEKVAIALNYLDKGAPTLLVLGRYVPGLRFVVNATLGLSQYPYRSFVIWSAIGGALWSIYTCVLAYVIATALAGWPLASVVISGAITTAAIAALFIVARRNRQRIPKIGTPPSPAPVEVPGPSDP